MSSENTSKDSKQVLERVNPVEEAKMKLRWLSERFETLLKKEQKISDIKELIKVLEKAEWLQGRADRAEIAFDIQTERATANFMPQYRYLSRPLRAKIDTISQWLEATIKREAKPRGFAFHWRQVNGFYLEIITVDQELIDMICKGRSRPETQLQEEKSILPLLYKKLNDLGFDSQIIETVKKGMIYTISAFMGIVTKDTAVAFLRANIEIRPYSETMDISFLVD